jgi:hypothetical protein
MTKAIVLLLAISFVGIPAYGQGVEPGGTTVPGSGLQTPPPQMQSSPLRWDTDTLTARGMSSQAGFRVPVTVRTEPGDTITVFTIPIYTRGDQRWVFGETADGRLSTDSLPLDTLLHGEAPFWSTEPFDRELYERIDSTVVSTLLIEGFSLDSLIGRLGPGSMETVRGQELIHLSDSLRALRPRPDRVMALPRDSLALAVLEPAEMCFEVEGLVACVKPWTAHEGFLARVHIDVPKNRKFDEVTVIGYYSRSTHVSAMEFPKKQCIWCGDVQICSAGAVCP